MVRELTFSPDVLDAVDWGTGVASPHGDALAAAIDDLDPKLRDTVNAIFYEGISKRALARREGISRTEVDKRMKNAMIALRKVLPHAL